MTQIIELVPAHVDGRCHTTHPELKFGDGILLGASCISPRPGYDIYIGFDRAMDYSSHTFPWDADSHVTTELFRIKDMGVPINVESFKRMCQWVVDQLKEGKKIHIGCIGGHGRTGMVIAAIKNLWDGEKKAIQWVRLKHCKKGVETQTQVDFLMEHFGVVTANPAKSYVYVRGGMKVTQDQLSQGITPTSRADYSQPEIEHLPHSKKLKHIEGKGSIFTG